MTVPGGSLDAKSVVFELTCGYVCERNVDSGRFSSEALPDGKKCFAPLPRTVYLVWFIRAISSPQAKYFTLIICFKHSKKRCFLCLLSTFSARVCLIFNEIQSFWQLQIWKFSPPEGPHKNTPLIRILYLIRGGSYAGGDS